MTASRGSNVAASGAWLSGINCGQRSEQRPWGRVRGGNGSPQGSRAGLDMGRGAASAVAHLQVDNPHDADLGSGVVPRPEVEDHVNCRKREDIEPQEQADERLDHDPTKQAEAVVDRVVHKLATFQLAAILVAASGERAVAGTPVRGGHIGRTIVAAIVDVSGLSA